MNDTPSQLVQPPPHDLPAPTGAYNSWAVTGVFLYVGAFAALAEAVGAVDDFKAERDDVRWTVKQRTMGEAKNAFVAAVGQDGVTDPSIVATRGEARTR